MKEEPPREEGAQTRMEQKGAIVAAVGALEGNINLAWHTTLQEGLAVLQENRFFKDIVGDEALGTDRARDADICGLVGYKEAFTAAKFRERMAATGRAEFACNFFWCSPMFSLSPSIPLNQNAVLNIRDRDFALPCEFPEKLLVATPARETRMEEMKGTWRRVNPEELSHAFLLAIVRDVQSGAAAQTLKLWRYHCLSTTMSFEVIASEADMFWRNANMRENVASHYQAVVRTAVQRVFEVQRFSGRQAGSMSAGAIHKLYEEKLKQANTETTGPAQRRSAFTS